jgi:hypothetical protein
MTVAAGSRTFRTFLTRWRLSRRGLSVACWAFVAAVGVFAAGEAYLRVSPPSDLAPYLPDSDRTGPFRDDPRYGVQYRSLELLAADNPGRFDQYRPLFNNPSPPRTWAFFGSSVVHGPAMLADTSRQFVPQRLTFNLPKPEPFPVRLAQAEFLLDSGLKPERIFLVIIPLDISFPKHALDQYRATAGGALAYTPRLPPVGRNLVWHSRLALKGWTQTKLHQNQPYSSAFYDSVDDSIRADVRTIFGHLGEAAARHGVPVTVVLVPNDAQICRPLGRALQDVLAEESRAVGFDVCDVCEAFRAWPNKPELFIPDKHFSDVGNRLLLSEIIAHMKRTDPRSADLPNPAEVRP